MKRKLFLIAALAVCAITSKAQSELYPKHFELSEVTLLDSPFKTAMELNDSVLLEYDVDRLLTPFVRQAGLSATTDTTSPYYQWTTLHPSFTNWGDSSFNLEGHVGGHYLSALALAYAAATDATTREAMKERLDYMVGVLKDCQEAFDNDTTGLQGFIGGQPINSVWTSLYAGSTSTFTSYSGWVPFYCEHKVLAGLRDAYLYGKSEVARQLFHDMASWAAKVVNNLTDTQMQTVLNTEHGGMNESMVDAYNLFGEEEFLTAAKRYSHQTMLTNMQTLNTTFLDGKHANTQVPKYIGFERVSEADATATNYLTAAENFWTDVAENRTVCIGGNSVSEHFLSVDNSNRYIDYLDGPESCNSNNMLKLSEMLSDNSGDAKYADFYEHTMINHILSTQDPTTGGYVYFTTLRPQGYRIYSQVNQAMWCCVGTGMENHSKYGHFIYTHDGDTTLYVNLFTASELNNATFQVRQETTFPYSDKTTLTVEKGGTYTIAVRHPAWTTDAYAISINGEAQTISVTQGTASYALLTRQWAAGDVVEVTVPMTLKYSECPNYTDYIAFEYGPVLLGAQTTATSDADATLTGLEYESLQNEYAGTGRMDHAPGSMATTKSLVESPLLIGDRSEVLNRITAKDLSQLTFTIDAKRTDSETSVWDTLTLKPFYSIHHARYMAYWYQQTADNYAASDMAASEAAAAELAQRTIDFVAPGEQQSEAGHEYSYSAESTTGTYNSETYRDAPANGYIQYTLYNKESVSDSLSIMLRFTTADSGRKGTLTVDGVEIADITVASSVANQESNGFYNVEYAIPESLVRDDEGNVKTQFVVRLTASSTTMIPGLYYVRLMSGYDPHEYQFVATDWTSGDSWRLDASKISYDTEKNTLSMSQTGSNNICLMMTTTGKEYTISKEQKYLAVRGTNLSTASGASYLWWLNGVNYGTQVSPTIVTTTDDGEQVIAWDMTTTGLDGNISGERPNVCMGQTIFGLTSTDAQGYTVISYIGYVEDVERDVVTAIASVKSDSEATDTALYTISGQPATSSTRGIVIDKATKKAYVRN